MSDQDHGSVQVPPAPGPPRRGVLRGAAGVGAAGLAAGLITVARTGTAEAKTSGKSEDGEMPARHDEPLVVHVHDASTGVVDLFTGTRHVRVSDRDLAARLARAAR